MNQEELLAIMPEVAKNPAAYGLDKCTLCGSPVHQLGVFIPDEQFAKRIGQPPGKQRVVLYAACRQCFKSGNLTEQIERKLLETHQ